MSDDWWIMGFFYCFNLEFRDWVQINPPLIPNISFFHSNLGSRLELLIIVLVSGSLVYSCRISFSHYGIATEMEQEVISSSFLESASATTFSFPFLCIISMSKAAIFSIHFCCSMDNVFYWSRYWILLWSVRIMNFLPKRYCHHFTNACIIASFSLLYVDFNCLIFCSQKLSGVHLALVQIPNHTLRCHMLLQMV